MWRIHIDCCFHILQMTNLLSSAHLFCHNLTIMGIPKDPHYLLSPTLFQQTNHKAFHHIIHFLLTTLHNIPISHKHIPECFDYTQLPYTLIHCYPIYEAAQKTEFIQMCYNILYSMEKSRIVESPIFPIGSVRKSILQQPQGEKMNLILFHLSSYTLKLRLGYEYPTAKIPHFTAADRISRSPYVMEALKAHLIRINKETLTLIQQQAEGENEWQKAAKEIQEEYQQLKAKQQMFTREIAAFQALAEPHTLSLQRQEQRMALVSSLSTTYTEFKQFVDQKKQSRGNHSIRCKQRSHPSCPEPRLTSNVCLCLSV